MDWRNEWQKGIGIQTQKVLSLRALNPWGKNPGTLSPRLAKTSPKSCKSPGLDDPYFVNYAIGQSPEKQKQSRLFQKDPSPKQRTRSGLTFTHLLNQFWAEMRENWLDLLEAASSLHLCL